MEKYLKETRILNYSNPVIQEVVQMYKWDCLDDFEKIKQIYIFVRDGILFGYNASDDLPASKVLLEGYGQCNTKATLLMALLRAVGIPCRLHAFTIYKKLQKGAMTGLTYKKAPDNILHSWVEVYLEGRWYALEGVILDRPYITKLQVIKSECNGAFCGYGVAVKDFRNLNLDFNRNDTYIQSEGINNDLGVYASPDELYEKNRQNIFGIKKMLYIYYGRHVMNHNIKKIRNADLRNKTKYCSKIK